MNESNHQLCDEDWLLDVPEDELYMCRLWEYARESKKLCTLFDSRDGTIKNRCNLEYQRCRNAFYDEGKGAEYRFNAIIHISRLTKGNSPWLSIEKNVRKKIVKMEFGEIAKVYTNIDRLALYLKRIQQKKLKNDSSSHIFLELAPDIISQYSWEKAGDYLVRLLKESMDKPPSCDSRTHSERGYTNNSTLSHLEWLALARLKKAYLRRQNIEKALAYKLTHKADSPSMFLSGYFNLKTGKVDVEKMNRAIRSVKGIFESLIPTNETPLSQHTTGVRRRTRRKVQADTFE